MANPPKFEFSRSRGVVWVCDVAGSSSRLNSENGAEDTEEFLPRLYWSAVLAVECAGGKFIKWTGDGFLAWFETPLHRDIKQVASRCLEAVWQLTAFVNVTQLGLTPKRDFKIRHGITYEHDALLTKIIHPGGFESLDLIGRAVVLAFRLSGMKAAFPSIVAHRDIVEATDVEAEVGFSLPFRKWTPTSEERLKFFKGEKWGTNALYSSVAEKPRPCSKKTMLNQVKSAIQKVEKPPTDDARHAFSKSLFEGMSAGPEWSQKVAADYTRFVREELLGSLKKAVDLIERNPGSGHQPTGDGEDPGCRGS
jgi:class 3 adenylate cyclase